MPTKIMEFTPKSSEFQILKLLFPSTDNGELAVFLPSNLLKIKTTVALIHLPIIQPHTTTHVLVQLSSLDYYSIHVRDQSDNKQSEITYKPRGY